MKFKVEFTLQAVNVSIILPLVLISEESLEIAINAWDALFFGVAEKKKDVIQELFLKVEFWPYFKLTTTTQATRPSNSKDIHVHALVCEVIMTHRDA